MRLPLVRKRVVWHVGDRAGSWRRPDSSVEGLGLSVSECPSAWTQIAKLRGRTWELRPRAPRRSGVFLDVHSLRPPQILELARLAIEDGLIRAAERWKAMWSSENDEDGYPLPLNEAHEYSFHEDKAEAENEAKTFAGEDGEWRVVRESVSTPTPKLLALWSERYSGRLPDGFSLMVAWQVILERDRPSMDGFWWDDEYDPDGLSAPRGMIFYSRLGRWRWTPASAENWEIDAHLG